MPHIPVGRNQTGKVRCDDLPQLMAAFRGWEIATIIVEIQSHRMFPAFVIPAIERVRPGAVLLVTV
jgi:hypothetical protein